MSGNTEERLRWRMARVVVWAAILLAMTIFWAGAAVIVASAIR
jgi:hypothetical protein